ncbi:MAG: hypothetical protein EOP38_14420 [Rubrivivax sp.]|nr:MAG: hypothetical protein EOP38_14420 [Rubrivivax sp.]
MISSPTDTRTTGLQKALICLTMAAFSLGLVAPASAALTLSPKPLLASTNLPKPNVMLTMDTSGSMNFRHMPESSTTVNGRPVVLEGSGTWRHHPDDTYEIDTQFAGTMPGNKAETNNGKLMTQIKLRSPDINTIYYNPRQRYIPWALNSTDRYPNASITNAYIDPLHQTSSDKAIDLTLSFADTDRVCTARDRGGNCTNYDTRNITYSPGLYYLLNAGSDPNVSGNYVAYDINDGAQTFAKYPGRDDCIGETTCTQLEERQNFANWFVYYRTRMLLAKAALSEAFHDMDEVARVGWTTIKWAANHRSSAENPANPIKRTLVPLSAANRLALLTSIQNDWNAEGSTPLRVAMDQVGRYFSDTSNASPWVDDPSAGTITRSACRRSYNILTTDGYYNDFKTLPDRSNDTASLIDPVGDVDGVAYAGNYTPDRPYRDKSAQSGGYEDTLADYALKYWMTDLQNNMPNDVKVSGNDSATWQHLTQFTMGIGVSGTMAPSPANLAALTAGTIEWVDPQSRPTSLGNQAKIDDLWHAAINSRGAFYSVKDSQTFSAAVRDAIGRAESPELREGGLATASNTLSAGNRKFIPEYVAGSWRGELYAYALKADGNLDNGGKALWKASSVVPDAASRNLWVWNPDAVGARRFLWAEMGATNQRLFGANQENLVNYLRGDTSNEGTGNAQFRERHGATLPDFINANPVYVSDGTASVIFLGGNGGFVHAFRALDGREQFGFMPQGVVGNAKKLAARNYGISNSNNEHQYFVDGLMVQAEATIGTTASKILIGTLGGGGKGLYALNVTNVSSLDATTVMWDDTNPSNADVGYIFSQPEVGKLPNGQWKIFVGNGYNSTSGKAALLVIDLATGNIDSVVADNADNNGLGGVRLVRNSDQQVIAAYAGDLKGQMWRFEYSATSPSLMAVGYQGQPLFRATSSAPITQQPITAAPAVFTHPNDGTMVVFGTGKLLEFDDKTDTHQQTVYGVWDKTRPTESTSAAISPFDGNRAVTDDRSLLTKMVITANAKTGFYDVTQFDTTAKPAGWYMDLTIASGQRVIYPVTAIDEFALIGSVVPSATAAECASLEGLGYNFLLPAVTGAQYNAPVIDVNGDGVIDTKDTNSAGFTTTSDGSDSVLPKGRSGSIQNTRGQIRYKLPPKCPPGETCPVTREVLDRVWKRLISPPQPQ